MTGPRRPTAALGAAAATATLLALAACTPSGPEHPTPAPTTATSPTTTPPGLDPLDPPLDPGPTDPGADPTDVEPPALTWPDGSTVVPVPVDPGSARRVDAADLRTVARPSAGVGTELGFLTVGADGTVLVADSTQGVTEDTEHRTERLRLEGPGGVLELSTEPEGSELYLAWILADGGVVGYRTLGLQNSEAELVRFGPGARQATKLEIDGRWPLEEGLLDADGTLTSWDGERRETGLTVPGASSDIVGTTCEKALCLWSLEQDGDVPEGSSTTGDIVRAVGGDATPVARFGTNLTVVGAHEDTVVLKVFPPDGFGATLVILDVAARTARSVTGVERAAFDEGRLVWSSADPGDYGVDVVGGRSGDVHVLDVSSGTLLRVRHSGAVGAVLVAGTFLAWTFGGSDVAGPTRGLVVDLADALRTG